MSPADEGLVVDDGDPDRLVGLGQLGHGMRSFLAGAVVAIGRCAVTAKPPPGAGPARNHPPKTSTRSRIPANPCPPPSGRAGAATVVGDAHLDPGLAEGDADPARAFGPACLRTLVSPLLDDPVGHQPGPRVDPLLDIRRTTRGTATRAGPR